MTEPMVEGGEPPNLSMAPAGQYDNIEGTAKSSPHGVLAGKLAAEFVGMTLFVFVGVGSAAASGYGGATYLLPCLGFGVGIAVMAYAVGPISGAHLNPAVTFCIALDPKRIPPLHALGYVIAQLFGAMVGAAIVFGCVPDKLMISFPVMKHIGHKEILAQTTNQLHHIQAADSTVYKVSVGAGFLLEAVGTFLLCWVVLRTAVDEKSSRKRGTMAPLAIGLSVFLAHCVLVPFTNCSINPARSFGAAVVANEWDDHWLWWIAPLTGALFAHGVDKLTVFLQEKGPEGTEEGLGGLVPVVGELVGMTLFLYCGVGAAAASGYGGATYLLPCLAFGIGITVLVYAIADLSGGHLNPAVTLCLALRQKVAPLGALKRFAGQMVGCVLGALIIEKGIPKKGTSTLHEEIGYLSARDVFKGTLNRLHGHDLGEDAPGYHVSAGQGFGLEVVGTFLLCFVVLRCACDKRAEGNAAQAPLAIGLSVFLAHCVLVPFTNCSINPARSFGAAVASWDEWGDHWIFWIGPLTGAALAAAVDMLLLFLDPESQQERKPAPEVVMETGGSSGTQPLQQPQQPAGDVQAY